MSHKRNRTRNEKIDDAIDKVNNIHPSLIPDVKQHCHSLNIDSVVKLTASIKKYLNINKPVNKYVDEYWIKRGWSGKPTSIKMPTRLSAFDYKFWMYHHNMNECDARYKANSIRPICKEYWIEKGYSDNVAIQKARETKLSNNKKATQALQNKDKSDFNLSSPRCLEHWVSYHLGDVEKAKLSLANVQRTFSKDICIEKHGMEKGTKIWEQRQLDWQNTLTSKPQDERDIINIKKGFSKNGFIERHGDKWEVHYKNWLKSQGYPIIESYDELVYAINDHNYYNTYKSFEFIILPEYITVFVPSDVIAQVKKLYPIRAGLIRNQYSYTKYSNNGKLLKSSYEIHLYDVLTSNGLVEDVDFIVDKPYSDDYKGSRQRSDFYFIGTKQYIEVCGMMEDNVYEEKMLQKQNDYGAILLMPNNIDIWLSDNLHLLK